MNRHRILHRLAAVWLATAFGVAILCATVIPTQTAAFGDSTPGPAASSDATAGSNSISVLAQTPWVTSGQTFQLRLQVSASDPTVDKLSVEAFSRLTTRTDFHNAVLGRVPGFVRYADVVSLSQLPTDPQGGVDVNIPVNPAGSGQPGSLSAFEATGVSGVFPLQLSLDDPNGAPLGKPLTTFLVWAAGGPTVTGFPRLSVGLVVPIHSSPVVGSEGQLGAVSPVDSSRLSQLAAALGRYPEVDVSLAVTPQTLDALTNGSSADRVTLGAIASLGRSADEVLPATYAPVSVDDLFSTGLGSEFGQQQSVADATLGRVFASLPAKTVWVLDGPVDPVAVGALGALGMTQLVTPDSDLTPLPASSRNTTFASPTKLNLPERVSAQVSVYAADPGLTSDFTSKAGGVLAATRLLAELSMIQVETPGLTRGVAVVPPARWVADPAFVDTLLAGLSGHPLLQSTTTSGLFEQAKPSQVQRSLVVPGTGGGSGGSGGASNLGPSPIGVGFGGGLSPGLGSSGGSGSSTNGGGAAQPGASASLSSDASKIKAARRSIDALQAILPPDAPGATSLIAAIQDRLLVSESNDVSESRRAALLAAVGREANHELGEFTLPGSSSITLTATKGQIPLTVLSLGGARAKVELRLNSQRLIFRAFDPANGHCFVPTPTSETCELTLAGQNTTLKVPVETRSSGVFPLDVSLWTPGGGQRLAVNRDTVRSTAVSNVGLILIIVAVASLAIWWGRDLRHGRRARKLVPPPTSDEPHLSDDPAVRDFFDSPPPNYPEKGDSPARQRR